MSKRTIGVKGMSESVIRILLIGGSANEHEFYQQLLIHYFEQDYELIAVSSCDEVASILSYFIPDCLLIDNRLFAEQDFTVVNEVSRLLKKDSMPFVLLTDTDIPFNSPIAAQSVAHILKSEI